MCANCGRTLDRLRAFNAPSREVWVGGSAGETTVFSMQTGHALDTFVRGRLLAGLMSRVAEFLFRGDAVPSFVFAGRGMLHYEGCLTEQRPLWGSTSQMESNGRCRGPPSRLSTFRISYADCVSSMACMVISRMFVEKALA